MFVSGVATPPHLRLRGENKQTNKPANKQTNFFFSLLKDGSVKVWEWMRGRLICSEQVGKVDRGVVEEEEEQEEGTIEAVIKTCCSSCPDSPLIVAALEKLVPILRPLSFS